MSRQRFQHFLSSTGTIAEMLFDELPEAPISEVDLSIRVQWVADAIRLRGVLGEVIKALKSVGQRRYIGNRFGYCPICAAEPDLIMVGKDCYMACPTHPVYWWVGYGLFTNEAYFDGDEAAETASREYLSARTEVKAWHPPVTDDRYWKDDAYERGPSVGIDNLASCDWFDDDEVFEQLDLQGMSTEPEHRKITDRLAAKGCPPPNAAERIDE